MSDHICIKSAEIDKMMEWIVGTGLTYTGLKIFKKKESKLLWNNFNNKILK